MGSSKSKGFPKVASWFDVDSCGARWREWALGHNRSAEYDGSATVVRKSWFGRQGSLTPKHLIKA